MDKLIWGAFTNAPVSVNILQSLNSIHVIMMLLRSNMWPNKIGSSPKWLQSQRKLGAFVNVPSPCDAPISKLFPLSFICTKYFEEVSCDQMGLWGIHECLHLCECFQVSKHNPLC